MLLLAPAATVASVQGNDVQAPVAETKVRRGGVGSLRLTPAASEGPLFVTTTSYEMFVFGTAFAGPLFVTLTSAFCVMLAVAVGLVFVAFGACGWGVAGGGVL